MALDVKGLERRFSAEVRGATINLPDPGSTMSVEAVKAHYANTYPELVGATVHGPEMKADHALYRFETKVGVKG
jgi:PRTRC genetic system protein C